MAHQSICGTRCDQTDKQDRKLYSIQDPVSENRGLSPIIADYRYTLECCLPILQSSNPKRILK